MIISSDWIDYKCIASGNGEKIEKWGTYILRRPDPQIIWDKSNNNIWNNNIRQWSICNVARYK